MNRFLDKMSDFLAAYPGLLPLVGLLLIGVNLFLQIYPGPDKGWLIASHFFLHLGIILALLGILLIRPISHE